MHGGKSTGPKTPEGKARVVAAMVEGRRKWVERMKTEGRKFLCGRKAGPDWVTLKMKERAKQAQEATVTEDRPASGVEFEQLTTWSLAHLRKILMMPLPPTRAILSIQCRTDPSCLEVKAVDIMPRVIALLKSEAQGS
jgi:hypothetical protein